MKQNGRSSQLLLKTYSIRTKVKSYVWYVHRQLGVLVTKSNLMNSRTNVKSWWNIYQSFWHQVQRRKMKLKHCLQNSDNLADNGLLPRKRVLPSWIKQPTSELKNRVNATTVVEEGKENCCLSTVDIKARLFQFFWQTDDYLANIFRGRIEYELIYSLRGAKHLVDYSVYIRWDRERYLLYYIQNYWNKNCKPQTIKSLRKNQYISSSHCKRW